MQCLLRAEHFLTRARTFADSLLQLCKSTFLRNRAAPHRFLAVSRSISKTAQFRRRSHLRILGGSRGLDIGDESAYREGDTFKRRDLERDRRSHRRRGYADSSGNGEIYPGACSGRRPPRPRGSGRRRSTRTAGSFSHVPDTAERRRAGPRARRAIGARSPRASQSTCGNLGEFAGLTDLGELAKSRRPWAADSGPTSLSPDATRDGASAVSPGARPPFACAFGSGGRGLRWTDGSDFAHHDATARRFDSSRDAAAPALSLRRCRSDVVTPA